MSKMKQAAAVCKTFGDGQKVIAAVPELEAPAKKEELSVYQVKGRTVTQTYVNESGKIAEEEQQEKRPCFGTMLSSDDGK